MGVLEFIKDVVFSKKFLIAVLIAAAIAACCVAGRIIIHNQKDGKLTVVSRSSLEQVIEISELPTVEYTYNAVAKKADANEKVLYYVSYNGFVTAGIDFSKITFDISEDEENPRVTIHLPEVTIQDCRVDMGSMKFIFKDSGSKTETVSEEAYKVCKADLQSRVTSENELFSIAKENAQAAVKGLYEPWIRQLNPECAIVVE